MTDEVTVIVMPIYTGTDRLCVMLYTNVLPDAPIDSILVFLVSFTQKAMAERVELTLGKTQKTSSHVNIADTA